MKSLKQMLSLCKSKFDYYPGVSLLLLALLATAFISFLIGFVGVMLSEIYEWSIEKLILDLLGVERKYEALRFLGIGMGGIVLVAQAVISYKRAKAMEDTAKAQAKATELQAKANENTEQGQRQERLKNAIEHLGHDSVSIRLGGAYELFHLAQDTKELRQTVLDILCAHIRQTTGESGYREEYKSKPSEEIQSLLTLLFVREHDVFKGLWINLQGSWLNGAELHDARLVNVALDKAYLRGASLGNAWLQGARLFKTQLQEALLFDAKLQGAKIIFALLQGAELSRAQLQGAWLDFVKLQGAQLERIEMQGAALYNVSLQGAVFVGAKLHGVTNALSVPFSLKTQINDRIDMESDLSGVTFTGGLEQEDIESLVDGLSNNTAEQLRTKLVLHFGKPASHELPEDSGAITGTYTEEEAEQWIEEYNNAMGLGEDDS